MYHTFTLEYESGFNIASWIDQIVHQYFHFTLALTVQTHGLITVLHEESVACRTTIYDVPPSQHGTN